MLLKDELEAFEKSQLWKHMQEVIMETIQGLQEDLGSIWVEETNPFTKQPTKRIMTPEENAFYKGQLQRCFDFLDFPRQIKEDLYQEAVRKQQENEQD